MNIDPTTNRRPTKQELRSQALHRLVEACRRGGWYDRHGQGD